MPRYFIDTCDQHHFVRDEEGYEFATPEEAKQAAVNVLPEMALDALPQGHAGMFLAVVRDEQGRNVFQASLTLEVAWLEEPVLGSQR